jgi:hypothetical protein
LEPRTSAKGKAILVEIKNPLCSYEFSRILQPAPGMKPDQLPSKTPPTSLMTVRHPKAASRHYFSDTDSLQKAYSKRFDSDLRRKLLFLLLEQSSYQSFSNKGKQEAVGPEMLTGAHDNIYPELMWHINVQASAAALNHTI